MRTGTKVKRVIVRGGEAKGVVPSLKKTASPKTGATDDFIEAPVIVYAGPIFEFLDIVDQGEFPGWFVRLIKKLPISKRVNEQQAIRRGRFHLGCEYHKRDRAQDSPGYAPLWPDPPGWYCRHQ